MIYTCNFVIRKSVVASFKDTRKKHPKIKLQLNEKYEYGYLGRWYIKLTLFKRL